MDTTNTETSVPAGERRGLFARLAAWDVGTLRYLGSLTLPKAVSLPLIILVRIGDGWAWCAMAVYLWFAVSHAEFKLAVAHCVAAIAISLAFYWPIKLLVRRPRPHDSGLGVTAKVPPLDKFSFPSGHTMNNLAVALTLSIYLPYIFWPALLIPLFLGALRVLFGVHYLSDIVAGGALGALSFVLAKILFASSFLRFGLGF